MKDRQRPLSDDNSDYSSEHNGEHDSDRNNDYEDDSEVIHVSTQDIDSRSDSRTHENSDHGCNLIDGLPKNDVLNDRSIFANEDTDGISHLPTRNSVSTASARSFVTILSGAHSESGITVANMMKQRSQDVGENSSCRSIETITRPSTANVSPPGSAGLTINDGPGPNNIEEEDRQVDFCSRVEVYIRAGERQVRSGQALLSEYNKLLGEAVADKTTLRDIQKQYDMEMESHTRRLRSYHDLSQAEAAPDIESTGVKIHDLTRKRRIAEKRVAEIEQKKAKLESDFAG